MVKRLLFTAVIILIFAISVIVSHQFRQNPQRENNTNNAAADTEIEQPTESPAVSEEPEETPQIRYQLTDEERSIVERVVMAESGNQSLLGQMAVAQCILNTAEATGQRPNEVVATPKQYATPAVADKVTEDVKYSVSLVFDKGEIVTDEPIRFFYAPKYSSGNWHESALEYVETFDEHKFFKIKD